MDRWRPIGGELDQDAGRDIKWRARRKSTATTSRATSASSARLPKLAPIAALKLSIRVRRPEPRGSLIHRLSSASLPCLNAAHKFSRDNYFNGLSALLRNFFAPWTFLNPRSEAPISRALGHEGPETLRRFHRPFGGCPFVSDANEAESRESETIHFAKRNETFRIAGLKSLKSLQAVNHPFRGIVCFQCVKRHFVLPFSRKRFFVSKSDDTGFANSVTYSPVPIDYTLDSLLRKKM